MEVLFIGRDRVAQLVFLWTAAQAGVQIALVHETAAGSTPAGSLIAVGSASDVPSQEWARLRRLGYRTIGLSPEQEAARGPDGYEILLGADYSPADLIAVLEHAALSTFSSELVGHRSLLAANEAGAAGASCSQVARRAT